MIRMPSFARPESEAPQRDGDGVRSWIVRGANFVIVYSELEPGAELHAETRDEHFVYMTEGALTLLAGGEQLRIEGESLAIVPPGQHELRSEQGGAIVQLFTSAEAEIVALAVNADLYADGAAEVVQGPAWPEPVGGYALRGYRLTDVYAQGRGPFAFRTRKLMAAPYPAHQTPRDETALSPHSHVDFEQGSVALDGRWVHHLRVPWSADRREWREDVHEAMDSPSIAVVPAGMIHTSQSVGGTTMRLLDVFAPPRTDFSAMPGAVRNADVYPAP